MKNMRMHFCWGRNEQPHNYDVSLQGYCGSATQSPPSRTFFRMVRYASVVGRENVIGGVDCGFSNVPTGEDVDPKIAWAKLKALGEGARLATRELWPK